MKIVHIFHFLNSCCSQFHLKNPIFHISVPSCINCRKFLYQNRPLQSHLVPFLFRYRNKLMLHRERKSSFIGHPSATLHMLPFYLSLHASTTSRCDIIYLVPFMCEAIAIFFREREQIFCFKLHNTRVREIF